MANKYTVTYIAAAPGTGAAVTFDSPRDAVKAANLICRANGAGDMFADDSKLCNIRNAHTTSVGYWPANKAWGVEIRKVKA